MNKTKDGVLVEPGQVWKELDKRFNRVCVVQRVEKGEAHMRTRAGVALTLPVSRMHNFSAGWELCP